MLRNSRFYRWLKCRHKWERYELDDTSLLNCNLRVYETMRYDAKGIIVCKKCSEIRTVGKGPRIIW